MNIGDLTVAEIGSAVARRELSAVETTRHALARIASLNQSVNAFISVFADEALERARTLDARLHRGEHPGLLAGVPLAIKDNIVLDRGRTTCGSRMLAEYSSPFSATVAERLESAGAVLVGKTNLDEFAMGSSTEHSHFGATSNPWDLSRVPGGSSGGSAAAVAAGMVPGALGSDTGGSIRQPASHCGVVGLKPTYGRVSRYGLVAYASSLDQIGPLCRTVRDAGLLLSAIAGFDARDSTSAEIAPEDFTSELEHPVKDLKLGVPRQAWNSANAPSVTAALEAAIEAYRLLGAQIVEVDLPHIDHAIAAYYLIATAEASSNLARFDGIRYGRRAALNDGEGLMELYCRSRSEGLGPEVQKRIMLGTHALSSGYYDAYYLSALKVRRLVKNDHDAAFGLGGHAQATLPGCHALIMPAAPGPAFKRGEKLGDPMALYLEDVYTVGVNLAGLPAITLPAGFAVSAGDGGVEHRLPIGVQLVGPALSERVLLRIARMLERVSTATGAMPEPALAD